MELWPVVVWWLLFMEFLLVGLPLADRLLPDGSDGGAGVAIALAVVTFALPTYWLGHLSFGVGAIVGGVVVLLGLAALTARGGVTVSTRGVIEVAAVFTVAYLVMVAAQASNAGISPIASERFLDYGLFRTVLRADHLPPEDLWFAGTPVRYYYGGHFVAALFARLTTTPGRYAYALALAGFYAMELTAVYGLAGVIADAVEVPRRRAALGGAFLFGVASNLLTPVRVLAGFLPEWGRQAVLVTDRTGGVYDTFADSSVAVGPSTFDYWSATRIIPASINEFPLFAYLHADLHAHMTSIAVTLVAVAVLYGYYGTPAAGRRRRIGLLFGVLPAVAGLVLTVNPWSFPTVLGLALVTVAAAPAAPASLVPVLDRSGPADRGGSSVAWAEGRRLLLAVAVTAGVGALALLWAFPFVDQILMELADGKGRGIGILPDRTGLLPFVLIHGAFLVTFWGFLAGRIADRSVHLGAAAVAFPVLALAGSVLDLVGLALVGPLLCVGLVLLRTERAGFETVLLVAGAGLVLLVEFVYLVDAAGAGRGNTVFKTYMQTWTFWAIAGGVAGAALTTERRTCLPITPAQRGWLGETFAVLLVVSLSLYGGFFVLSPGGYYEGTDAYSIDGLQYAHAEHPGEAAAIEWLDARPGKPTLVSKPGFTWYTWESAPSSLTGIPTVAGSGREMVYRSPEQYHGRASDIAAIYNGTNASRRARLLVKYDVEYVYLGPRERSRYDWSPLADDPGISVAFENEAVTVYAVNRSGLVE